MGEDIDTISDCSDDEEEGLNELFPTEPAPHCGDAQGAVKSPDAATLGNSRAADASYG